MRQHDYRDFKKSIPREALKPNPWMLLFLFTLWVLAASAIYAIAVLGLPWFGKLCLSLVIGYCWAIGGLIGHELLHGSIVRNKKLQDFLGFFCFLPFLISPTFWRHWHNNLHHSFTQKVIMDPDAYPTYRVFKQSRFVQWMYKYSPGSGTLRSYLYFFFWFTFNAQVFQYYFRFRNRVFDKVNHKRVNVELVLGVFIHLAGLYLVGPQNWFFAVFIPFLVQNYIPFSYISTNHNLNPLTSVNDPLLNSLTVTNPPILEFLHVHFGYHVEHHLMPTVNGVHLKKVHRLLKAEYPEKYLYMPKGRAMAALYKTARIYKTSTTLMNPMTGKEYPTLGKEPAKESEVIASVPTTATRGPEVSL
ncbi:MAG: fatty acid desaturase [Bdellovibrionales bacterium]|nr:fatty acid desaturase [Bdellovibrionales bacterium]